MGRAHPTKNRKCLYTMLPLSLYLYYYLKYLLSLILFSLYKYRGKRGGYTKAGIVQFAKRGPVQPRLSQYKNSRNFVLYLIIEKIP